MKLDYKYKLSAKPNIKSRMIKYWHVHSLLLIGALFIAVLLTESDQSQASIIKPRSTHSALSIKPMEPPKPGIIPNSSAQIAINTYDLILPPSPSKGIDRADSATNLSEHTQSKPDETEWQTFTVKPGYNLGIIAEKAGVGASEIRALMNSGTSVAALKTLYPGDVIQIKASPLGKLLALQYDLHESRRLLVQKIGTQPSGVSKFEVNTIDRPLEIRYAHASGTISHSLFLAASEAGLSPNIRENLTDIFQWDIDYAQDVRKGDKFTVVYEERYRSGEKISDGVIVAAEFINNGNTLRAVRYTDPSGRADYYAPDGSSLRKTFMRNPINFKRISSRFNMKRKHPILNKIRAHKGVDYAAAKGTPIRASGDGKIVHRGRKGGYGNTIIIQHGQRYSTLYAHMSAYSKDTRVGRRVKQGQTIGYVGSSGLATGPHLHYEFRVNGQHRNPLTIQHNPVQPIPTRYKEDFLARTKPLVAQLETISKVYLALNE